MVVDRSPVAACRRLVRTTLTPNPIALRARESRVTSATPSRTSRLERINTRWVRLPARQSLRFDSRTLVPLKGFDVGEAGNPSERRCREPSSLHTSNQTRSGNGTYLQ